MPSGGFMGGRGLIPRIIGTPPKTGEVMKLYIANCSKQDNHFTYMLPEQMRPFARLIRAGQQTEIDSDFETINIIIRQHEIYGIQEAKKVKKGFGGLCYQIDKPISIESIKNGFTQTEQEQIDRALEARKITAASSDQLIAQKAQEFGMRQTSALEVEVIEEKKGIADESSKFEETIGIVRDGLQPIKNRGRPKKGN